VAVQPSKTSSYETEVRIKAERETVFGFFTDPEKVVRWMGTAATLDPRPGGIFRLTTPAEPNVVEGRYVEVLPPERLVFSWGWRSFGYGDPPLEPGASTVEVTLVPDGDHTVVHLKHRDLPPEALDFHRGGWSHYLPRLAIAAAGGDPGVDPLAQAIEAGEWPEGVPRPLR
jgi:uncharacterized protein YndB with AHSA1/START domain